MAATEVRNSPLAELLSEATEGQLNGMQLSHLIQDIQTLLKDDLRIEQHKHLDELKQQQHLLQRGYVTGFEVGYDQALIDLDEAGSLLGATARRRRRTEAES